MTSAGLTSSDGTDCRLAAAPRLCTQRHTDLAPNGIPRQQFVTLLDARTTVHISETSFCRREPACEESNNLKQNSAFSSRLRAPPRASTCRPPPLTESLHDTAPAATCDGQARAQRVQVNHSASLDVEQFIPTHGAGNISAHSDMSRAAAVAGRCYAHLRNQQRVQSRGAEVRPTGTIKHARLAVSFAPYDAVPPPPSHTHTHTHTPYLRRARLEYTFCSCPTSASENCVRSASLRPTCTSGRELARTRTYSRRRDIGSSRFSSAASAGSGTSRADTLLIHVSSGLACAGAPQVTHAVPSTRQGAHARAHLSRVAERPREPLGHLHKNGRPRPGGYEDLVHGAIDLVTRTHARVTLAEARVRAPQHTSARVAARSAGSTDDRIAMSAERVTYTDADAR